MLEEHRLDRIEQKLDKLTEAVSQIARVEEQMLSVFKRMDRHEKRLDDQEDDIRELTENLILNNKAVSLSERLFWVVISALTATVVYYIR